MKPLSLLKAAACAAAAAMLPACSIEPPLKLADAENIDLRMPEVVTNIDVLWEIEPDWRDNWWYGWDQNDIDRWGPLEYPTPSNYEVRVYYLGSKPSQPWLSISRNTIYGSSFRRRFQYGYHDLLLWSNIDSPDGTQALVVNEDDASNVQATTSRSRVTYKPPVSRASDVFNNPEIFYAGLVRDFEVSDDISTYDYFDEERNVWVKELPVELTPLVYTYLVQVVIYNNRGRITGTTDRATVSAMADGVSLHTGRTSANDVIVAYEMGMKRDLPARDGQKADILGGKLTTFGLCDMEPWSKSRSRRYSGGRADLHNHVIVNFGFNNGTDSVYRFEVTPQMQAQSHGGVVTIEVNADTLTIPHKKTPGGGSVFQPTIEESDSITHEFGI